MFITPANPGTIIDSGEFTHPKVSTMRYKGIKLTTLGNIILAIKNKNIVFFPTKSKRLYANAARETTITVNIICDTEIINEFKNQRSIGVLELLINNCV